jgi:hypothetical protein
VIWRRFLLTVVFGVAVTALWRYELARWHHAEQQQESDLVDRDRDGLDDRVESKLAHDHLPSIHEYMEDGEQDECLWPRPRPILYRARPLKAGDRVDLHSVAITYVLLYDEDCGPLGHKGDDEAFTVFVREMDGLLGWRTVGAIAMAHRGTTAELRSTGAGRDIWVSRNKHANFATFDACEESGLEVCAKSGPPPSSISWLNVGEPGAPLSNDVGEIAPGSGFRGLQIWNHGPFLEAGDLTAQFYVPWTVRLAPGFEWPAEDFSLSHPVSLSRKEQQ